MRANARPLTFERREFAFNRANMRRSPALLLMAWLVGLAGCFGDPSMKLPSVPSGDIEAKLEDALQALHDAAREHPRSGERRGELAMAYDVNGFYPRAVTVYGQAATLADDEFAWPYYRALLLARSNNDYEAALRSLADAIALDDGYVPAWLYRGQWLRELGRTEEAHTAFARAAELGAGAPSAVGTAHLLLDERRFQEAVAILEPINAQTPDPRIEALLGRAYRALGREEDARIASAKGQRATSPMQWLDPRLSRRTPHIAGFGNLLQHAQNLIQAGRPSDALVIAEALAAERPDDIAAINTLVWANAALKRFATVKSILRDGIRRFPEEPRLHQMMANAHLEQGDSENARRHLEKVTALAPDNARALEELGWLYARDGRADEAEALLERALEAGAREPKEVLYRLGLLDGAANRWAEAADRFRAATRLDAAFTMAHVHLARCLAEAGDFDAAQVALDWADRLGTHARERASARRRLEALRRGER